MSKVSSGVGYLTAVALLIGLAGFVRGSWAQDVKQVTPEPLERDVGDGAVRAEGAADTGEEAAPAAPAVEEGVEEKNGAVRREPLERDLDHPEAEAAAAGDAVAAEEDVAPVMEGVVEILLGGGFNAKPGDGGGNIPANLRPFMPALNDALTIEIHFLRKVCNPDEKQLKVIRAAGEKKILEMAKVVARNQHQAFNDQTQGGRGPLQEGLLAAAKDALPADKYEAYRKELEARKAARVRGACEMMTLAVDNTLSLPLDDYDTAVELLTEKAEPQWTHSMQTFFYQDYCPLPGVELIKPVLNDRQQKIWSAKPRRNSGIVFGWPANIGLQQWGLNVRIKELDDYSREVDDE